MNTWSDYAEIGLIIHFALLILLTVRILFVQRNTSVAIAWLAILFALPFVGIIAYILVGEPMIGRQYQKRSRQAREILAQFDDSNSDPTKRLALMEQAEQSLPPKYAGVSRIGTEWTGFGIYPDNRMQLLTQADEIFDAMIQDIQNAQHILLLEFYIIYPQGRVLEVFETLKQAVKRGVDCHILADSVGSFSFFNSHNYKDLLKSGISVHQSLPVGLFKTLFKRSDLRNHRKIFIIDDQIGYTGSFNLVDPRYFKQDAHVGQWVDVMMRIHGGQDINLVTAMSKVAVTDMSAENDNNLKGLRQNIASYTRKLYALKQKKTVRHPAQVETLFTQDTTKSQLPLPEFSEKSGIVAQLIPSAPQMTAHVIYNTLCTIIYRANRKIQITTPYFVPDDGLLNALTTAARRGVEVTLILPKKVDSFLAQHASEAYYQELLDAGVTIARFDKGLLHTKTVIIDDDYCLFGTVNMDMRSFYLNMEVSLAIYSPSMVADILACQNAYLAQCEILKKTEWEQRKPSQRLLANIIRLFGALL